jgi:hypothetical protein
LISAALDAFVHLLARHTLELAAIFARLLVEQYAEYEQFSTMRRQAVARKLIRAVIEACDAQAAAALIAVFADVQRWESGLEPPYPLAELEALGQTLSPTDPILRRPKL